MSNLNIKQTLIIFIISFLTSASVYGKQRFIDSESMNNHFKYEEFSATSESGSNQNCTIKISYNNSLKPSVQGSVNKNHLKNLIKNGVEKQYQRESYLKDMLFFVDEMETTCSYEFTTYDKKTNDLFFNVIVTPARNSTFSLLKFNLKTKKIEYIFTYGGGMHNIKFSPSGRFIAYSRGWASGVCYYTNNIEIFDLKSKKFIEVIPKMTTKVSNLKKSFNDITSIKWVSNDVINVEANMWNCDESSYGRKKIDKVEFKSVVNLLPNSAVLK